jgi:hypothetical protein
LTCAARRRWVWEREALGGGRPQEGMRTRTRAGRQCRGLCLRERAPPAPPWAALDARGTQPRTAVHPCARAHAWPPAPAERRAKPHPVQALALGNNKKEDIRFKATVPAFLDPQGFSVSARASDAWGRIAAASRATPKRATRTCRGLCPPRRSRAAVAPTALPRPLTRRARVPPAHAPRPPPPARRS